MSTAGSRAMTMGLTVLLFSVSAAMHLGADCFGSLLCFVGVLVGASLVAVGIRMADGPAPVVPVVSRCAQALAPFVRRNIASVGLVMASCAVAALQEDPVLCVGMIALLLLGVSLINMGTQAE